MKITTPLLVLAALAALAALWLALSRERAPRASSDRPAPDRSQTGEPAPHEQRLKALHRARALRVASQAATPTPGDTSDPAGALTQAYVKAAMPRLRAPILRCRDAAIAAAPQLEGAVMLSLDLAAEPELGGLVESCGLAEGALTPATAELLGCVCTALLPVELAAPSAGGRVRVTYPITLSTGG